MKRSDFKVGIVGAGWIAAKAAETLNGLEGFYIMELMDGLRQVGLGVSKLTHETVEQMSLFEDPKMEYYREWDRQYDAGHSKDRSKKD